MQSVISLPPPSSKECDRVLHLKKQAQTVYTAKESSERGVAQRGEDKAREPFISARPEKMVSVGEGKRELANTKKKRLNTGRPVPNKWRGHA